MQQLSITTLLDDYRSGARAPASVISSIFAAIRAEGLAPVWISLADEASAVQQARTVDLSKPLAGVPFAVKDNIDVEALPTTAGCPSFAYSPAVTATVVRRLQEDHLRMEARWGDARKVLDAVAQGQAAPLAAADEAALDAFAGLYDEHIRAEEQLVYPAARAVLDADAQRAMGEEMARRRGIR